MIYKIREKFWALGDNFTITDQHDVPRFQVVGKVFSWGDDLSFQSADGTELARIKQKMFSMMPRYKIYVNGDMYAEISKKFSWINQSFHLDVPGPNDYEIEGSFWQHDFTFYRGGAEAARVSKAMFSWTDAYAVDIRDPENEVAILCACIVIDQILHDGDD